MPADRKHVTPPSDLRYQSQITWSPAASGSTGEEYRTRVGLIPAADLEPGVRERVERGLVAL
jgi:hypothetical protein